MQVSVVDLPVWPESIRAREGVAGPEGACHAVSGGGNQLLQADVMRILRTRKKQPVG